jgi:hypothetical protein
VDEHHLAKRQKFITVVSNLETGERLWFGRERNKETLDRFSQDELSVGQRRRVRVHHGRMTKRMPPEVLEYLSGLRQDLRRDGQDCGGEHDPAERKARATKAFLSSRQETNGRSARERSADPTPHHAGKLWPIQRPSRPDLGGEKEETRSSWY